jgi:hypothetical protein
MRTLPAVGTRLKLSTGSFIQSFGSVSLSRIPFYTHGPYLHAS